MDINPEAWAQMKIAFAGFCGGFFRLIVRPEHTTTRAVMIVVSSSMSAYFFTCPLLEYLGMTGVSDNTRSALANIVGLFGLAVAEAVFRAVEKIDLVKWVKK